MITIKVIYGEILAQWLQSPSPVFYENAHCVFYDEIMNECQIGVNMIFLAPSDFHLYSLFSLAVLLCNVWIDI